MHQLEDGTIIPSELSVQSMGGADVSDMYGNASLMIGEVKELIWPNDPKSQSKRFVEYTVEVSQGDYGQFPIPRLFTGCIAVNVFGGTGDFEHFTYRANERPQAAYDGSGATGDSPGIGNGAKVLLMCVQGYATSPVILGGVRQINVESDKDDKESGHHYRWVFNGASFSVNKDGEVELRFGGSTNTAGEPSGSDSNAIGTKIFFDKKGNAVFATKDDKEIITLDHENGKVLIKSSGVKIGDATENFMMGKTYRHYETVMHNQLKMQLGDMMSALVSVTQSLGTVSGLLLAASTDLATPAASKSGASVALNSAAMQFVSMTTKMAEITQKVNSVSNAIQSFENRSDKFLSNKNFND